MRSIQDQIAINASRERVFQSLIRPSDICGWWEASTALVFAEKNGLWVAAWGDADDPDYLTAARMIEFDSPSRILMSDYQYRSKSGPMPFEADFEVEFRLTAIDGATNVVVIQNGFPDDAVADEFFQGCVQGWRSTLANLKRHIESAA